MGFGDILKDAGSEGKEKHVPHIDVRKAHGSEAEDLVNVLVGKETPHPNTVEHGHSGDHVHVHEEAGAADESSQRRASMTPGATIALVGQPSRHLRHEPHPSPTSVGDG